MPGRHWAWVAIGYWLLAPSREKQPLTAANIRCICTTFGQKLQANS